MTVESKHHLRDPFVLTAHRGAVDRAPENTLLAFQLAEQLGFEEAELDVQLSLDGHLVVAHDRTLERLALTPNAYVDVPIEQLTLKQLRTVDLGLGQRVATFEEVLAATSMNLQVEIKAPRAATALGEYLQSCSAGDAARCMVTSFEPLALHQFHATGVQLARGTGLLVADVRSDWPHIVGELPVRNLLLHWPGLERRTVELWRDRGYRVFASMLNHVGELRRAIETGVDGSSTDRPLAVTALLAEVRAQMAGSPSRASV